MSKYFFLAVVATITTIFISSAQADNVYKWVDENGVTHYGDEERMALSLIHI